MAGIFLNLALSSRVRGMASSNNNANDDPEILDLSDENIYGLPTAHPNYEKVRLLFLKNNRISILDASLLPPNLELLDVENNLIHEIRGTFPQTLTALWLDNNKLTKLPKFPAHITDLRTEGNPIEEGSSASADASSSNYQKTFHWYSQSKYRDNYTDDEQIQFNLNFLDEIKYSNNLRKLKAMINVSSLCHQKINDDYFDAAVDVSDEFCVEKKNKRIIAFALLKRKSSILHIDLLCSSPSNPGGGSRILNKIFLYFAGHPELKKITLNSLPSAVQFYESKQFRRCIQGEMCPMEYIRRESVTRSASVGRSIKTRKARRKNRRTVKSRKA